MKEEKAKREYRKQSDLCGRRFKKIYQQLPLKNRSEQLDI